MTKETFLETLLLAVRDEFAAQVERAADEIVVRFEDGTERRISVA